MATNIYTIGEYVVDNCNDAYRIQTYFEKLDDLFITNKVEATDHKYKIATFRVLCGDQLLEIVKANQYDKKTTFDEVKEAVIKHFGYQVNKVVAKKKF